jgi:hypothetical protein
MALAKPTRCLRGSNAWSASVTRGCQAASEGASGGSKALPRPRPPGAGWRRSDGVSRFGSDSCWGLNLLSANRPRDSQRIPPRERPTVAACRAAPDSPPAPPPRKSRQAAEKRGPTSPQKNPASIGYGVLSSPSRTRTCNLAVNSRSLYH